GKGIIEFRKGIRGIEEEIESATSPTDEATSYNEPDDDPQEATAPKFGSLVVAVSPPDAEARIVGGPPAAESLLKTLRVEPAGSAERRYHLPMGNYRVHVTCDGYADADRKVSLTENALRISVELARQ
ncbi:hypothetical protein CMK11_17660, partial [Candidatus Poribacteria bacterium]|nr:hypothetical protein [Candidatus Poribacteria bacterium]